MSILSRDKVRVYYRWESRIWVVVDTRGFGGTVRKFETKKPAVKWARDYAKEKGRPLEIENKNGGVSETTRYD